MSPGGVPWSVEPDFHAVKSRLPYKAPLVHDYGDLAELTADYNIALGAIRFAVAAVSAVVVVPGSGVGNGGGGGGVQHVLHAAPVGSGSGPGGAGEAPGSGVADTVAGGGPGSGSGNLTGTAAGRLPFSGYAAGVTATVGMGMALAGASLRARLRRTESVAPPEP